MKNRGKLWVVRAGDGETVGEILRRANETERALAEGRVFVGRKRVLAPGERVVPGDAVTIGVSTERAAIDLALRRDDLVACIKPAGIPTVPDHTGSAHALVARAAEAVSRELGDLRVTSRLDRDVSGVVVFALTASAEAALVRARSEGTYDRRYVAIAAGSLEGEGAWDAPIGAAKDPRLRSAHGEGAKHARTRYRAIARAGGFTLLALAPVTGRTHQIRVHASHAGAPLFGDRDYGGAGRVTTADGRVVALARIALHCARVTVPALELDVRAPIPPELARAWTELGGAGGAWETAASCALGA